MSDVNRSALALMAASSPPGLRESLLRLDAATRARVVGAVDDIDQMVTVIGGRLEARVVASLHQALRSHAWLALGLAVGLGVLLSRGSRRR